AGTQHRLTRPHYFERPGSRLERTRQHAQQRALAGPVASDQRHAVTFAQDKTHVVDERREAPAWYRRGSPHEGGQPGRSWPVGLDEVWDHQRQIACFDGSLHALTVRSRSGHNARISGTERWPAASPPG